MDQNINNIPQEEYDEIDIMELVRKFLKEWKLVLKWCGIAAVIGVIAALSAVSTYTVTTKMSPESTKSGSSSLSSLASLAGINIGGMSAGSDAISPDLYPEIVSSVPFLTKLFYMPVEAEYKGEPVQCNYYEYLKNCGKAPWYSYVTSLPGKALGAVFGLFQPKEEKEPKGFKKLGAVDNSKLTKAQENVIKGMRKNISVATDKKTFVITLSVTDQDPEIAMKLSETIVTELRDFITSYRTEKARNDLEYYEKLYEESQADYFEAQQRYARYSDMNQGMVRQSVMVERERLQNEMQLKYQLYNSCAQQVQMAKAQVQRETPVCTILTPPTTPLQDNESGAKTLAICVFLGFCLAALWVLWGRDWIAKLKNPEDDAAKE